MWNRFKIAYGIIFITRLGALILKFEQSIIDPKYTMVEHLRTMLVLICDLKAIGSNLTNEEQATIVIHHLPKLWGQMKLVLNYH